MLRHRRREDRLVVARAALVAFGEDGSAVPGWARPAAILLALAYVFAMYLWRREIRLVAKLLAVASASVRENPLIVAAVLAVKFVALFVLVPVLAFVLAALRNGSIAPNPDARVSRDGETCVARADDGAAASFGIRLGLVLRLRAGRVGPPVRRPGALLPPLVRARRPGAPRVSDRGHRRALVYAPRGRVSAPGGAWRRRGARRANRPSVRERERSARSSSPPWPWSASSRGTRGNGAERRRGTLGGGGGIGVVTVLACAASCCLECVAALVAFVSKFATIRAALSGEAFCDAARSVARLFAANGMSAYGVWWLPGYLLSGAMFVFAAAYAWAAFGASGGWMRLLGRSGCVLAPSDETIGEHPSARSRRASASARSSSRSRRFSSARGFSWTPWTRRSCATSRTETRRRGDGGETG